MNLDFNIDFSNIPWIDVRKLGISIVEIYDIFKNPRSTFSIVQGENIIVGFSTKRKFIVATYEIAKNINFDVEVLQIDLPYEEDIEKYWCTH
jgi:hypothetical protein